MRAANLLGGVAFEQGRLDDAEARFEETLRRAHLLNDAQMAARASNNLGSLVHLQGKDALAVNLYCSALHVYRMQGDRLGTAQTCHNLALAYRLEGRFVEALDANHQAVEAAEQAGDQALLALTRMGRAETWLEWGEPTKAETELRVPCNSPRPLATRPVLERRNDCWPSSRCSDNGTTSPCGTPTGDGRSRDGCAALNCVASVTLFPLLRPEPSASLDSPIGSGSGRWRPSAPSVPADYSAVSSSIGPADSLRGRRRDIFPACQNSIRSPGPSRGRFASSIKPGFPAKRPIAS